VSGATLGRMKLCPASRVTNRTESLLTPAVAKRHPPLELLFYREGCVAPEYCIKLQIVVSTNINAVAVTEGSTKNRHPFAKDFVISLSSSLSLSVPLTRFVSISTPTLTRSLRWPQWATYYPLADNCL